MSCSPGFWKPTYQTGEESNAFKSAQASVFTGWQARLLTWRIFTRSSCQATHLKKTKRARWAKHCQDVYLLYWRKAKWVTESPNIYKERDTVWWLNYPNAPFLFCLSVCTCVCVQGWMEIHTSSASTLCHLFQLSTPDEPRSLCELLKQTPRSKETEQWGMEI